MTNAPIISWYDGLLDKTKEIKNVISYGTVESDSSSNQRIFYIANNLNGSESVSKMEDVTFVTKDRSGGTGDSPGNIVEAVRDNWVHVRVDSLDEEDFTAVGKDNSHSVGTNGTTINPHASTSTEWTASSVLAVGEYIKPTVDNGFIYKVSVGGTTGSSEPSFIATEGSVVTDGAVQYIAEAKEYTAGTNEILGVANSVLEDGSNAEDAGANFIKLTTYVDVPVTASSGKNSFIQRVCTGSLIQ